MAARTRGAENDAPELEDDVDIAASQEPPESAEKPEKPSKKEKQKKAKGDKKGKGGLIAIALLVLVLGAAAAVIALNLFGLREDIIMPYLRNAPLIGQLFPEPVTDPIDEMTPEQLRMQILILTQQVESLQDQNVALNENLSDASQRIEDLMPFHDNWHRYLEARATFDQMLAHGDPHNFVQFFSDVNPDNVLPLVEEALRLVVFDEETMGLVRTMNSTDESHAGETIESLMLSDTELMLNLLRAMTPRRRAEIFETMEASVVSILYILLSPPAPTFTPLVPPYLPLPIAPVLDEEDEDYEEYLEDEEYPEDEEYEETDTEDEEEGEEEGEEADAEETDEEETDDPETE